MSDLQHPKPSTGPMTASQDQVSPAQREDETEIDLGSLFWVLFHHLGQIIACLLIVACIALAATIFLIKPTYRSGFTAFVNNRNGQEQTQSMQSGDVAASQSLTRTYAAIMTSRPVVEDALKASGLADLTDGEDGEALYEYDNVKELIETDIESDAQLVNLYVTMRDPEAAYRLADAISQTAPGYISDIVDGTSMKIVSGAILPTRQYSPNPMKNAVIGGVIGALLAIVYFVVRELTDTRVKNEQDLQEHFNIPVIGTIPDYEDATSSRKKYGNYGYYAKAEKEKKKSDAARARSIQNGGGKDHGAA